MHKDCPCVGMCKVADKIQFKCFHESYNIQKLSLNRVQISVPLLFLKAVRAQISCSLEWELLYILDKINIAWKIVLNKSNVYKIATSNKHSVMVIC